MKIQINNPMQKLLRLWCLNPYINDIISYLKNLEQRRVNNSYNFIPEETRNNFIGWLIEICEYYEMDRTVLHLAISIFDTFVSHKRVEKDRFTIVIVTAVILANKFDGSRYCNIKDLLAEFPHSVSIVDYFKMEVSILKVFDWNLNFPTVAHFIDLYSLYVISSDDLEFIMDKTSEFQLWKEALIYINRCLDIVIFDSSILKHKPSVIASAIIMGTRIFMNLFPIWTIHLMCLTEYFIEDLLPLTNLIVKKINNPKSSS